MSAFTVEMACYVCRWCGCAYAVPTMIAENQAVTKRCPNGHVYGSRQSINDELASTEERIANLADSAARDQRTIASLRGQITKLRRTR